MKSKKGTITRHKLVYEAYQQLSFYHAAVFNFFFLQGERLGRTRVKKAMSTLCSKI